MSHFKHPLFIMKVGVIWFYTFALIAHFFAPEPYNILMHNFSQLGPQGYALSWVMQIAFIGSAILWFYGLYLNTKTKTLHTRVAIMFAFIALFIVVAGIFKTTLEGVPLLLSSSSTLEKNLHLLAAHSSQVLGLLILLEHIRYSDITVRKHHVRILVALIILSIIFQFGPLTGVTQRVLALTHSYWTLRYLNLYTKKIT